MLKIKISPLVGIEVDADGHFCSFGILEGVGLAIAGVASGVGAAGAAVGAGIAGATGIGATTAGLIGAGLVDAGIGAGLGAGEAAITGGDPGTGALLGGITGGAVGGFGGLAGDALGIGTTAGDTLVGAAAGAGGAGATGSDPLTGALGGAASGLASGVLSSTTPSGAPTTGATSPGASAPALAAPSGTPLTDLTAGIDTSSPLSVQPTASLAPQPNIPTIGAGGGDGGVGGLNGLPSPLSVQPTTALAPESSIPTISGGGGGGASGGGSSTITTAFNNPTSGNILSALGANAGPLVAGAGLITDLAGNQTLPGQNEIGELAGGLQTQGQELSSYIKNGTLPPGAQAGIDQATKAAQAAIRSKYAADGMSGSSAEVQDLNNVTEQAQAQQFQEASTLLQEGLDATSISGQLYAEMMNFDQQQSAQTGAAISSLAGALSGGTVIKIGG